MFLPGAVTMYVDSGCPDQTVDLQTGFDLSCLYMA